ncbi:unnamed protein product [Polarella glacialis]|uniref:Uncharacterized protein n=1 Tax=Polarella glacialis TaxID=89957 RepID=A0A813FU37_POLGL|nr:unnamed protein product [Polarella glacialis]CAE8704871.1 unnamed protein product [Polarella glacialis]
MNQTHGVPALYFFATVKQGETLKLGDGVKFGIAFKTVSECIITDSSLNMLAAHESAVGAQQPNSGPTHDRSHRNESHEALHAAQPCNQPDTVVLSKNARRRERKGQKAEADLFEAQVQPEETAERRRVRLHDVRFSQDSCSNKFRDGSLLAFTIESLRCGATSVADLSIGVVDVYGFSLFLITGAGFALSKLFQR